MAKKKTTEPVRIDLSSEQELAVGAREGFYRVLAGAGAGKSACLIERYVRLVKEGIKPEHILSLTFTSAAAKSLRDRAEAQIGVQKLERTAGFITFHSLALSFCTQER